MSLDEEAVLAFDFDILLSRHLNGTGDSVVFFFFSKFELFKGK